MKARVKLTVSPRLISDWDILAVAQENGIVPSIRRVRVTDRSGEVLLEVEGPREGLEKALRAYRAEGVEVELVAGDMVES